MEAHQQISFDTVEELNTALENKPDWRAVESAPRLVRTKFHRYYPYHLFNGQTQGTTAVNQAREVQGTPTSLMAGGSWHARRRATS